MKKIVFVLVVVLVVFLSACSDVQVDYEVEKDITFVTLPFDSKYAGTYSAVFCNMKDCWQDRGEYKPIEHLFSNHRVHIDYVQGPRGRLVLSARPGYSWVWRDGGLFSRPGYSLEKNK